ncbi:N/A [soil metagenome]
MSIVQTFPTSGLHALIIEDDMIVGLDLQAHLAGLGYESFAFASTADQAVEQAKLRAPDLATVDVGLLDGDGLAAVRAVEAECGPVPTLFITGDPERAQAAHPGRVVLAKPFAAGRLRDAVERVRAQTTAPG